MEPVIRLKPTRAVSLAEVAALNGATVLVAVSASPASVTVSYSGLRLDVTGQNSAVGTQAMLWSCNGDANQQ
jgi:hypothetical protein